MVYYYYFRINFYSVNNKQEYKSIMNFYFIFIMILKIFKISNQKYKQSYIP